MTRRHQHLWNARDTEGMNAHLSYSENGIWHLHVYKDVNEEYPIVELRAGDLRALNRAIVRELEDME